MNRTNTLRFAIVGLLLTGFGCGKDKDPSEVDTPDAEVEDGSVDDSDGGGGKKDGGQDGGL